jgi:hypothetical protein
MKKLAVRRIVKKNIIDKRMHTGNEITTITQDLDKEATFWVAASAPKAVYIYDSIFC